MKRLTVLCLMMVVLFTSAALAGDLKAPIGLPSAKVLPKGVRNLSYKGVYASADNKFNNDGNNVVLADPLFRDVTFAEAIAGKSSAKERAKIRQTMLALGKNPDAVLAQSTGQINVKATAHVPVLAWGLNSRWTFAVAVPIIKTSVGMDFGTQNVNQNLVNQAANMASYMGAPNKQAELYRKLQNPVLSKLEDYHYEMPVNETKTRLGDIKVVNKVNLLTRGSNTLTIQGDVTLPTGEDHSHMRAVDVPSGDNQTDLGLSFLHDWAPTQEFTLSSMVGHTWQLKDESPERIPERADSKATPDYDLATERDLGDVLVAGVAGKMYLQGIKFGLGYNFQHKTEDRYNGTKYDFGRYKWLEADTRQNMHTVQASIGYDTLHAFRQKQFPVPLSITLNHSQVVRGKNVVKDPLTSLDFGMFF